MECTGAFLIKWRTSYRMHKKRKKCATHHLSQRALMRSILIFGTERCSWCSFRLPAKLELPLYTHCPCVLHTQAFPCWLTFFLYWGQNIDVHFLIGKVSQHQIGQSLQCHTASPLGVLACDWTEWQYIIVNMPLKEKQKTCLHLWSICVHRTF